MNNRATGQDAAQSAISHTRDDGGDRKVGKQFLEYLKQEMHSIATQATEDINHRRRNSEDVRFCRWDGQSPDGLKHERDLQLKPHPFEGSSDARVRKSDQAVNETMMLQVTSALRSNLAVKAFNLTNQGGGSRLSRLLRWVIKNQLGADYRRQLIRMGNWLNSDVPAAAIWGTFWQREQGIRWQTISLEQIPQILQEVYQMPPEEVADVVADIQNPSQEQEWANWLTQLVPGISEDRALRVIQELRDQGKSRFPLVYDKPGGAKLTALRLFDDIFIPSGISDLEDAPVIFHREWLSEYQLEERQVSFGYAKRFVKEVPEKGNGKSGFPEYEEPESSPGDASVESQQRRNDFHRRGRYEVITAYFKAVNEDGITGTYVLPFSACADVPATDRQLLDYPFDGYPFEYAAREYLTSDLWDSRSVPELLMTEQQMLKFLTDSQRNHTHLSTVPPVKSRRRKPRSPLKIKPLAVIQEDRPGEIEFMAPPKYPIAAEKCQEGIELRVAQYAGLRHPEIPADLTRQYQQFAVDNFLDPLGNALAKILQLTQAYMPDEELELITGDDGGRLFASREEIQGRFAIEISFAAGAMEMEWVVKVSEIISKYLLPMDTLSTIQRDKLLAILFSAIDPSLADATLVPAQSAQQQEVDDEVLNLTKIIAGIEPDMAAEGQNFALRKDTLEKTFKANPEIAQKMTPVSKMIFDARLKHLTNQVQQEKNKVIGRQVGQTVLT